MKKISRHKLLTMILTLVGSAMLSMTAMADETTGALTSADDSGIRGWAWNKGSYDETVDVELHIYKDNSKDTVKVITVPANSYNADVSKSIGDGYHAFESKVNWSELGGTSYKIEAYAIAGEEKTLLPDPIEYKPTSSFSSEKSGKRDVSGGPGVVKKEVKTEEPVYTKGESLGIFTTTAYCNCSKCSGGHGLTYSGTVPQADHTLSADLSVFPLGTKVMIDGIVYTVEDRGSGVNGNKVDIYFATHEEALKYGTKSREVYAVAE